MNFFKKIKAAKDHSKNNNFKAEPIAPNGTPHSAPNVSDDDIYQNSISPRFNLSYPLDDLPEFPTCSRLSKSLLDTLKDVAALGLFIQYLESQSSDQLVRFWLDADSFRITARSRLRSELNNAQIETQGHSAKNVENPEDDTSSPTADSVFSKENKVNKTAEALALTRSNSPMPNGDCLSQTSQVHCDMVERQKQSGIRIADDVGGTRNRTAPVKDGSPTLSSSSVSTLPRKQIESDAVAIYQKYICPNVTERVRVSDDLYHSIVSRICCEDGNVDPDCFVEAQIAVFEEMRERFPPFLESEFHLRYQIELLTRAKLTLSDILYHENALIHFMEFVEVEGGLPLIQFWLLVANFAKLLRTSYQPPPPPSATCHVDGDASPTCPSSSLEPTDEDLVAQADAMIIYDKYFSLQATESLVFGDDVRFKVEANICTEDGKVEADCFDLPVKLVLNLIAKEYLQPFLQSPIYYRWLSELINTVRLGGVPSGGGHRARSGSDASSSEASVTSSLQATSTGKRVGSKKRDPTKSFQDMIGESRIDVDANPDDIWSRKHNARPLIFGRIDPMGDYRSERGFHHPDTLKKKGSNRITKALKNLVQDESEVRAREEMAAQLAQKLINDVTSLTMGKPAYEIDLDDAEEALKAK